MLIGVDIWTCLRLSQVLEYENRENRGFEAFSRFTSEFEGPKHRPRPLGKPYEQYLVHHHLTTWSIGSPLWAECRRRRLPPARSPGRRRSRSPPPARSRRSPTSLIAVLAHPRAPKSRPILGLKTVLGRKMFSSGTLQPLLCSRTGYFFARDLPAAPSIRFPRSHL